MTGTGRIAMRVRYDGTDFHGSQLQSGQRTVSDTLTTELSSLLEQDIHLLWAGRTDTGVHADGNVCAFDARPVMPVDNLVVMLNNSLPPDIRILAQWDCAVEFHPRFDALLRHYTYRIWRGAFAPVDRFRFVHEQEDDLDLQLLQECAALFAGRHCFRAFCRKPEPQDECICELQAVEIMEHGRELTVIFRGNRFLRHMICRLVGAITGVAGGRLLLADVKAALETGRELKLTPAPARGLTLTRVDYP